MCRIFLAGNFYDILRPLYLAAATIGKMNKKVKRNHSKTRYIQAYGPFWQKWTQLPHCFLLILPHGMTNSYTTVSLNTSPRCTNGYNALPVSIYPKREFLSNKSRVLTRENLTTFLPKNPLSTKRSVCFLLSQCLLAQFRCLFLECVFSLHQKKPPTNLFCSQIEIRLL